MEVFPLSLFVVSTNIDKKVTSGNNIMVGKFSNISTGRRAYAGMTDKGGDFFVKNGNLYLVHDKQIHEWPNFPKHILRLVRQDLMCRPEAIKSLALWENMLPEERLPRYITCNFGGLDDEPDIDESGNIHHAEYVECRLRGTCPYEGKLCRALKVRFGVISGAEMEVLKLADKPFKIIADQLCRSIETVKSHMQSIKEKTGCPDKTEVAVFAYQKGLINK